jgi:methyl-accepting chemotaxis protein
MHKHRDLSVARRLSLAFGLLIVLTVAVAVVAAWGLQRSAQALKTVYEDRTVPLTQLTQVRYLATRDRVLLMDATMQAKADTTNARLKQFMANRETSTKIWKEYRAHGLTPEEVGIADAVESALKALVDQGLTPTAAALQAGQYEDAVKVLQSKVSPLNPAFIDEMAKLVGLQTRLAKEENEAAMAAQRFSGAAMALAVALAVGAGLLMGWRITRSLVRALGAEPGELAATARTIADGQLGDDGRPRALAGSVMASMQAMRATLHEIVGSVRGGVESVATASAQIAQGNADLSSRTEEQASSLQQTAASMEQLTGTVRQSADTARQANQLAQGASESAARGGQVMTQVVQTMGQIQDASKRIADIIGVIDSIAFQTNILALNAAVEAARAGEQGRGFAVVASEVRSLAQRSAEAARQIKTLIGDSAARVESGGQLVSDAGRSMETVVADVQRVCDLIAEISAAAGEQSQGIEQVGQAVTLLDQTTQQNAALVEESAAAAESLKAQAATLAQTVATFRLEAVPA